MPKQILSEKKKKKCKRNSKALKFVVKSHFMNVGDRFIAIELSFKFSTF